MSTAERYMTVKQVAETVGVNPETVRTWIRSGKLEAFDLEGSAGWRVRESDLDDFMARRAIVAGVSEQLRKAS